MSYDAIADISREIAGLLAHRHKDVSIRTESVAVFAEYLSRHLDMVKAAPTSEVKSATFMGVEVKEDFRVPPNMAVILAGDEIVNIVKFH